MNWSSRPFKRVVALLFLSLLSLLILFLALEIAIRSYDVIKGRGFFSSPRNILAKPLTSVRPFRTFGRDLYKKSGDQTYISSRWGELYPLEKPPGTFRIVCFGGSTTEDNVNGKHYPLLLQTLLRKQFHRDNIEVINVGYSAYATPHLLILLELDVLSWRPDLVILGENVNDLLASYFPGFTFDYSNKYSHPFYSIPNYRPNYSISNLLFQHFEFYWFIKDKIEIWLRTRSARRVKLRRKSYGNEPGLVAREVFERNLRSFVTLAKSNQIQVVLATQPLERDEEYFVRHAAYKPYNDVVVYPLHEEFIKHHDSFNRIIEHVASDTGVIFVDNDRLLGGKKEYFIDYVHYSEKGLEILAQSYSEAIINSHLIYEASTSK